MSIAEEARRIPSKQAEAGPLTGPTKVFEPDLKEAGFLESPLPEETAVDRLIRFAQQKTDTPLPVGMEGLRQILPACLKCRVDDAGRPARGKSGKIVVESRIRRPIAVRDNTRIAPSKALFGHQHQEVAEAGFSTVVDTVYAQALIRAALEDSRVTLSRQQRRALKIALLQQQAKERLTRRSMNSHLAPIRHEQKITEADAVRDKLEGRLYKEATRVEDQAGQVVRPRTGKQGSAKGYRGGSFDRPVATGQVVDATHQIPLAHKMSRGAVVAEAVGLGTIALAACSPAPAGVPVQVEAQGDVQQATPTAVAPATEVPTVEPVLTEQAQPPATATKEPQPTATATTEIELRSELVLSGGEGIMIYDENLGELGLLNRRTDGKNFNFIVLGLIEEKGERYVKLESSAGGNTFVRHIRYEQVEDLLAPVEVAAIPPTTVPTTVVEASPTSGQQPEPTSTPQATDASETPPVVPSPIPVPVEPTQAPEPTEAPPSAADGGYMIPERTHTSRDGFRAQGRVTRDPLTANYADKCPFLGDTGGVTEIAGAYSSFIGNTLTFDGGLAVDVSQAKWLVEGRGGNGERMMYGIPRPSANNFLPNDAIKVVVSTQQACIEDPNLPSSAILHQGVLDYALANSPVPAVVVIVLESGLTN